MPAWILVEIIVFLIRSLLRLIRCRKTRTWPTVEGEIQTSGDMGSSYPAGYITYWYSVNGERHFGTHERAFFLRQSAKEYAKQFIPKWKVIIRYSAKDPDQSFVSEGDQASPPVWATRFREE